MCTGDGFPGAVERGLISGSNAPFQVRLRRWHFIFAADWSRLPVLAAGFSTALASVGVIKLTYQLAVLFGVTMAPPFRVQLNASGQWFDFPFIDQLEIVSRLCSLVALSKTDDNMQFPVLGASAVFELHSAGGVVDMWMCEVAAWGASGRRWEVRMIDVGDFFFGSHLRFADGLAV